MDFDELLYDNHSQSINQMKRSSDIDNLLAESIQLNTKQSSDFNFKIWKR
jgi:hypothetical protein